MRVDTIACLDCLPGEDVSHAAIRRVPTSAVRRSEEHTSELQSQSNLVCRLLLEKKKKMAIQFVHYKIEDARSLDIYGGDDLMLLVFLAYLVKAIVVAADAVSSSVVWIALTVLLL